MRDPEASSSGLSSAASRWTSSPRTAAVRTPVRCRLWKGDLSNSRKRHQSFVAAKASQLAQLRHQHAAAAKRWRQEKARLEAELRDAKHELAEVRRAVGQVFTDTQVTRLRNGSLEKWSEDDIVRALSIRCVSFKCYRFLRDKLHFPLPGLTTLRTWTKAFQTPPGLIETSLKIMRSLRDTLPDVERYVVLSFDEMAVDSRLCYDSAEDRVYGPSKNVQVIMVRSLCSHWKQAIYFDFDQDMTRDVLFAAITAVEAAGYLVVATVCDLSPTNRRLLWTEGGLGIKPDDAWFQHPCDPSRKIYPFADVPHMLKLLRNHILDQGLRLPSGAVVDKTAFEPLLGVDSAELRLCHKLTPKHLTVTNQERQRVSLAAQMLSETVGRAMQHCLGDAYKRQAEFILNVDHAFDAFNSRHPLDSKSHRCGFGMPQAFDVQYDTMLTFTALMRDSRVGSHKSRLPFQDGFIMSSTALRGLHSALCTRPEEGLKYILTSRLTQDFVENFFSQIRGMGGTNNHPTPVEVKTRIRLLLMGASPTVAAGSSSQPSASGASVAMEEESPTYLSASALKGLGEEATADAPDDVQDIHLLLEDIQTRQAPSTSGGPQSGNQKFSREALAYVAGFLAYKCRAIDGTLGKVSSQCVPDQTSTSCDWICQLSRGGLSVPSPEWLQQVEAFEVVFCAMHGTDAIDRAPGVIRRLRADLESKYSRLDSRVLKKYAVTRTNIRLKWLQRELEKERRLRLCDNNQRRNAKRMRLYARSAL